MSQFVKRVRYLGTSLAMEGDEMRVRVRKEDNLPRDEFSFKVRAPRDRNKLLLEVVNDQPVINAGDPVVERDVIKTSLKRSDLVTAGTNAANPSQFYELELNESNDTEGWEFSFLNNTEDDPERNHRYVLSKA